MRCTRINNQPTFESARGISARLALAGTAVAVIGVATTAVPAQQSVPDPVAEYKLNHTGGTFVLDSAGTAQHGTIVDDSAWVDDPQRGQVFEAGSTTNRQHVEADFTDAFSSESYTFSTWYKFDGNDWSDESGKNRWVDTNSANERLVLSLGSREGGSEGELTDKTLAFYKGGWQQSDIAAPAANEWHHVAFSFDANSNDATIYKDVGTQNQQSQTLPYDDPADLNGVWGGNAEAGMISHLTGDRFSDYEIYDQALSEAQLEQVASQDSPDGGLSSPRFAVDRNTGQITLEGGGPESFELRSYEITSESESLDSSQWKSIAANYDADDDGSVDSDEQWVRFTKQNINDSLAEGVVGSTTLDGSVDADLGQAWIKSATEDLQVEARDPNGDLLPIRVEFTGNGGQSFPFGDLDFDGDIDMDDWRNEMKPNIAQVLADTEEALENSSTALRYQQGDLNDDGRVDIEDFYLMRNAFNQANNGQSNFLSLVQSVPEPSSVALLGLGAGLVAWRRRRA